LAFAHAKVTLHDGRLGVFFAYDKRARHHDFRLLRRGSRIIADRHQTLQATLNHVLTVDWYRAHQDWVLRVKSGEYQSYYQRNYANR
jgi:dTDP-D-glucose 4,6-dehydratase